MALSQQLLDKLACPKCRGGLLVVKEGEALACRACNLLYAVRDGIPVMIVEQASSLSDASLGDSP